MKRIIPIFAVAVSMLATGCQKEQEAPVQEKGVKTSLKAVVTSADTRVAANAAGKFSWQDGDEITVFDSEGTNRRFSTIAGGDAAEFTFDGAVSLGDYALYPYSPSSSWTVSNNTPTVTFHLPAAYADWKSDETLFPMIGTISQGTASFKAVGGALKVIAYNVPETATKLTLTATHKKISGAFEIADASAEEPVITTSDTELDSEKQVEITFTPRTNMVFYIPLPTGTIDGFTLSFDDDDNTTKVVTNSFTVNRNQIVVAPALNCAPTTVVWYESFTGYATETTFNASPIVKTGTHDAIGDDAITYTAYSTNNTKTRVYGGTNAGCTTPELIIQKSGGYFQVQNIPVNGHSTFKLEYNATHDKLVVGSTNTSAVTISDATANEKKYTRTIEIKDPATTTSFDIKFSTPDGDNIRVDNLKLFIPGTDAEVPTLSVDSDDLTIAVGELSQSTTVTYTQPVDDQGVAVVVSADASEWLSANLVGSTLTVSALEANLNQEARVGTVTLRASGVKSVPVTVTQPSSLVVKPTILNVTADDDNYYVKWDHVSNATGYTAYVSTSSELTDYASASNSYAATGPSEGKWTVTIPKSDVSGTNYVYVVLTGVAPGYTAQSGHTMAELRGTRDYTVTWTVHKDALGNPASTGFIYTTNAEEDLSNDWTYKRTNKSGDGYTGTGLFNGYLQIGSRNTVENLEFSTSDIPGTIVSVTVDCASYNGAHNVAITVGGDTYLSQTATPAWSSNTGGEMSGTGTSSGEIVISFTDGTRAMYIKSITVVYNN